MSPNDTVEMNWGRLAGWIVLQVTLAFGVGFTAAFAALAGAWACAARGQCAGFGFQPDEDLATLSSSASSLP